MGYIKFMRQGIFFFTRACAYSSARACLPAGRLENSAKQLVISTILVLSAICVGAASKETLFSNLQTESDAMKRVSILAQLNAAHLSPAEISKIEPAVKDADPRVRAQAIALLGNLGTKAAIQPISQALLNDQDPGVRVAAAFWLGSMKSHDAIRTLEQALENDTEANVRAQAAQALKRLGSARAKSSLRRAKSDSDKRVKKLANE